MDDEYVAKLVVARLKAIPPNVGFSVGQFGDFTRDELIDEVLRGSLVGKAAIGMELNYLRGSAKISGELLK